MPLVVLCTVFAVCLWCLCLSAPICCLIAETPRSDQCTRHGQERTSCLFIPWMPPPKRSLGTLELSSEQLRRGQMAIKSTYSWTSDLSLSYPLLRRRPLVGEPWDHEGRPVMVEVGEDLSLPWRTAYREKQPEKAGIALSSLRRAYQGAAHQLEDLATRRRPWLVRVHKFLRASRGI